MRRRLYDAVTFAATGTLLFPKHSVAEVYWVAAHNHGHTDRTVEQVRAGLHRARYTYGAHNFAHGRSYWSHVATEATGSISDELHAELYEHYGRSDAWRTVVDVYTLCSPLFVVVFFFLFFFFKDTAS